jgi:transposase-like protein
MTRPCSVCRHPDRDSIDRALVDGQDSYRDIARHFAVSKDALHRHKEGGHIARALVEAKEAGEVARADTLLDQVKTLTARAHGILETAERAGDLRVALGAIREARGCLELLARVMGEIQSGSGSVTVNISGSREWIAIKETIVRTLAPYPDARDAVVLALDDPLVRGENR